MNLDLSIAQSVENTLNNLYGADFPIEKISIQETKKEFTGDRTVVVFPFLKISKTSPEKTASAIGEILVQEHKHITEFNVVKGFLNLVISDSYWIEFLNDSMGERCFALSPENSKSEVMVEFSSPNTNKPLHLGHLRNIFLGNSVSNILKSIGHKVYNVQIINDRGIHICKSMVAWKLFANGETPESSDQKGDKFVGKYYVKFDQEYKKQIQDLISSGISEEEAEKQAPILLQARETLQKWETKDPDTLALWEMMNGWVYKGFESSYKTMGVSFDKLYYESNTYLKGKDEVDKGLETGAMFKKEDGSVWCDLTDKGLDQKLVLRADGTAVYMTQDIGTAILRFQEFAGLDYQIYTVGNEQEYHFKVLFLILEKLGFAQAKNNYHLSYGMVELPEGKMKSREGTVVDADDIMSEMIETARSIAAEQGKLDGLNEEEKTLAFDNIGIGALKYFLLKVDPRKGMMFNPAESIDFQGNTGPFIQYTYVRSKSVLNKSSNDLTNINLDLSLAESEKNVIKRIYDFPTILEESAKLYNPGIVANYIYELVKDYNTFYQNVNILKEKDVELVNLRLSFSKLTSQVIETGMGLLGIQMPDRM